jgi:hypothetical protein
MAHCLVTGGVGFMRKVWRALSTPEAAPNFVRIK